MVNPRRWTVLSAIALLALALAVSASQATPVAADSGLYGGRVHPPTRLVIPEIGVDTPIEPVGLVETRRGFEWETLPDVVGWHNLSSVPGIPGNTVLSGHNYTRGGRVFKDLWKLEVGDRFTVYVGDQPYQYQVAERVVFRELLVSKIHRAKNAAWIGPFPDERVTLFTCHPTWANTHRLVVVGKPVEVAQQAPDRQRTR
jgi:sortase A